MFALALLVLLAGAGWGAGQGAGQQTCPPGCFCDRRKAEQQAGLGDTGWKVRCVQTEDGGPGWPQQLPNTTLQLDLRHHTQTFTSCMSAGQ